jgi:predicted DNA-binding transcriptional regulator AlpA
MKGAKLMNEQNALTEREAARYVGVSPAVFRLWRAERTGPDYFRAGLKLIRYRRRDLDGWIEARLSNHSGAKGEASQT